MRNTNNRMKQVRALRVMSISGKVARKARISQLLKLINARKVTLTYVNTAYKGSV
jgi:hypothetical protein